MYLKFVLCLMLLNGTNSFINKQVIADFFARKSIKQAVIVGCWKHREKVTLMKNLSTYNNVFIVIFHEEKLNELTLYTQIALMGVILDGDCPNIKDAILRVNNFKNFDVKHHWLVMSKRNNTKELFENIFLNINSDVMVVIQQIGSKYEVLDVYNQAAQNGGKLIINTMNQYDLIDGFGLPSTQCKYWMRRNMTGVRFRADVVLPVKYKGTLLEYLANDENRVVNTFNRFHSRLMGFCRDYYNFSVNIHQVKSWGYKYNETSFDGLVGNMQHHVTDFGYSPLFVREDRARVMEYGRRTWILRAAFIFRNPKSKTSVEVFLKPLSLSIWLSTIFSASIAVVALKMSFQFEQSSLRQKMDTTWSCLVVGTVGAFCQQGTIRSPVLICGRIAVLFLFFLSLLIYQFYSASIVSNLLQKPATLIKTIQEILTSGMEAGCEDTLYNRDYFLYTTDKASKELYHRKILRHQTNSSNFVSPIEGLALVNKGNYAFHVELATAYPIIRETFGDKAICDLREVQMYRTQPMHVNLQKYSPFRDMLDTCVQRLAEHGLLTREINHWHPAIPDCIPSSKSVVFNVSFEDLYPAFMALAIGILCSLIILVAEKYVSNHYHRPFSYAN